MSHERMYLLMCVECMLNISWRMEGFVGQSHAKHSKSNPEVSLYAEYMTISRQTTKKGRVIRAKRLRYTLKMNMNPWCKAQLT